MFGIQEGITEIILPVYFVFLVMVIRKRKHSGLSPQHEDEEDASRESGGSISEKERCSCRAGKRRRGIRGAREEEEEEMLASSVSDVEPKSEVPPCTQVKVS